MISVTVIFGNQRRFRYAVLGKFVIPASFSFIVIEITVVST